MKESILNNLGLYICESKYNHSGQIGFSLYCNNLSPIGNVFVAWFGLIVIDKRKPHSKLNITSSLVKAHDLSNDQVNATQKWLAHMNKKYVK